MNKLSQKNLTKSEIYILSSFRKLRLFLNTVLRKTNSLFKLIITKILLLVFIFFFSSISIFVVCKSRSFKKEGELFYKNIKYEQALEKYYEAKQWWLFERISPKLKDNDLEEKIQKAKVMVHSSELYNQGIKAYEEKQYSSAKWYLSNLAENDPRNEEAKEILVNIEKLLSVKLTPTISPVPTQPFYTAPPLKTTIAEPSYNYDPYYPIILSLSDNKGGKTKWSNYNQYSSVSSRDTGITLKIGDTIRWTAEASDPKGRQILYQFHSSSQRQMDVFGRGQYKTENWFEYTINGEDLKTAGDTLRIVVSIRSEKEYYRSGSSSDDSTFLDYKLQPN